MDNGDMLREYTELIKKHVEVETKLLQSVSVAVQRFDEARQKYEDATEGPIMKYLKVLQPFIIVTLLFLGAYLFVSTGHSLNIKAGEYQFQTQSDISQGDASK